MPQLRLQRAAEGFSVVAITYYIIGLLTQLALAAERLGWTTQPELVVASAIPAVVLPVAAGLWRIRRHIQRPLRFAMRTHFFARDLNFLPFVDRFHAPLFFPVTRRIPRG